MQVTGETEQVFCMVLGSGAMPQSALDKPAELCYMGRSMLSTAAVAQLR